MLKEKRFKLHYMLCDIIKKVNPLLEKNVYYRAPPSGVHFPCIMYDLNNISDEYSNNTEYKTNYVWKITIIDKDPDSMINEEFRKNTKYKQFDRCYMSNGLNYFVYTLSN